MKRWYKSLAPAALMLAAPAVGFAQQDENDGPPAPPPIEDSQPVESGAEPQDNQDVNVARQNVEQKNQERRAIVTALQDAVDVLAGEVDVIASDVVVNQPQQVVFSDGDDYWIGVVCEDCEDTVRDELNLDDHGLVIKQVVEDSPAADAGLKVEDILVSLGDARLTNIETLGEAIQESKGEIVYVDVIRDGQDVKLELKPAKRQVLRVDNNIRLHHRLQQDGEDRDVILHTIKEKPHQSFSFQVVRPGVIAGSDMAGQVLKLVSPDEVQVIELEGKIKAAIQGHGDVLLHTDDEVHEHLLHGVLHSHQDDEDSASDAKHEDHDVRIEFTQKDGEDSHYVIVIDGKKYEVKGDNFDELPENVRDHVKFLKGGRMIFGNGGNLFQRLRLHGHDDDGHDDDDHAHQHDDDGDDDAQDHIIRRSFTYNVSGDDDQDEQRIELRIEKSNDQPAKIVVKKGDNTWTVDEDSLDELPEEVRGKIKLWQSKDGNVFTFGGGENVFEFKQGNKGVFRVFGNKGDFKFEPKGEFKFEMPKFEGRQLKVENNLQLGNRQFNRLRLAPGNRFFLAPGSDDDDASSDDSDLAARIDALNKEIQALRKAIEKLADEIDD